MKRSDIYAQSYEQTEKKPVNEAVKRIDERKQDKDRIKKLGGFLKEERSQHERTKRRLREAEDENQRLREKVAQLLASRSRR